MSTTADEAGSDTAQASVVVTGPTADVVTVQVSGGITTDAAGKVAQAFDTAMTASREGVRKRLHSLCQQLCYRCQPP